VQRQSKTLPSKASQYKQSVVRRPPSCKRENVNPSINVNKRVSSMSCAYTKCSLRAIMTYVLDFYSI